MPLDIEQVIRSRSSGQLHRGYFRKGNIYHYEQVGSTNDVAKELALRGCPEGTVVVAESQTCGRGRLHRTWQSPKGGLYFSLVLRPPFSPAVAPRITLLAGVAVCRAVRQLASIDASIKWPNDVLVQRRKVAGILTEVETNKKALRYAVVGVGINVNTDPSCFPPELQDRAGSIFGATQREVSRAALLAAVLEEMEALWGTFLREGFEPIRRVWRSLSETLGRTVSLRLNNEEILGLATDIDEEGALLIEDPVGGVHKVLAGEVS